MPPIRKREPTNADDLAKLSVGDLVIAKVKGFPPWPAKIDRAEEWKREPDPKKVFVQFFGTGEIGFVAPTDVRVFNLEARKSLLTRLQGKSVQFFAQAVREICDDYDKLNCRDPTNPIVHGNIVTGVLPDETGNALSEEACVVTGTEDDHLLEGVNRRRGKSDHCLSKSDETIHMHTRSTFSCLANEKVLSPPPQEKKNEISMGAHSHCKIALLETAHNLSSAADNVTGFQSKITFKKCTNQVISAYYTRRSRVKKSKVETDGFEGVTNTENFDSIINAKITQKSAIGYLDFSKSVAGSMREKEMNDRSAAESLSAGLKSDSEISGAKETCSLIKRKKGLKVEGELDASENHLQCDLSERKCKVHSLSKKAKAADNELSLCVSEKLKGEINDETDKKPHVKKQKIDSSNGTAESDKKLPGLNLREETSTAFGKGNLVDSRSGDGAAIVLGKECILALEASTNSMRISNKKVIDMPTLDILTSAKTKPLSAQSRVKRRAICIVDTVKERPQTPVHGGLTKKTKVWTPVVRPILNHKAPNHRSQSSQLRGDDFSGSKAILIKKCPKSSKLHVEAADNQQDLVKIEMKNDNVSYVQGLTEFEKFPDLTNVQGPESSQVQMHWDAAKILDTHNRMTISGAVTRTGDTDTKSTHVDDVYSPHLVGKFQAHESKITSNVRSMFHDSAISTSSERGSSLEEIQRAVVHDPEVLHESKMSDKSMKLLIAAAQAKRLAARSQSISQPVNSKFDPIVNIKHQHSSSGMMKDHLLVNSLGPIVSPATLASRSPAEPELCSEKPEGRASLGHQSTRGLSEAAPSYPQTVTDKNTGSVSPGPPSTRGLFSRGTEAAILRDAFEGMIETLSRTKESIGRATRLAIDCAKYGIANEVVELLVRKLENEPNLRHRVNLFFLVDSIMQRSHNQKGITGASYASTVEVALPRLLSAAAPSGASACENRQQCLKVLRLWIERKILPASVLRRFMDDIGVSNGTTSAKVFFKRPSRAERSCDDPIREMEGMLVDEYGSNAAMQLPGFSAARIFIEEEEDEGDDNLPSPLSNVTDEAPQISISIGNQNVPANNLSDERNASPKNEDGEREMVKVSGNQKVSCPLSYFVDENSKRGGRASESDKNTLKFCPKSPSLPTSTSPLPLVSPSPPPPLPSSPAPSPPPPPPQQCSPPPLQLLPPSPPLQQLPPPPLQQLPPPPPLQQLPPPPPLQQLPPPPPLQQLPPPPPLQQLPSPPTLQQLPFPPLPHPLPPPQSTLPPPPPLYPPPTFHSYPTALPSHHSSHPSRAPSYPLNAPFTSTGLHLPPLPSARPILMQSAYSGPPQNSVSGQPVVIPRELAYQSCMPSTTRENLPIPICTSAIQGQYGPPLHAVTMPPPPSSHFSHASSIQQRPNHTPNQPFIHEGYCRPAFQMPVTSNLGFQRLPPYNAVPVPSEASVPGHSAGHIWPRPHIGASNCWRPA